MIDLRGKTARVTGGSRGIGRACSTMLGRAGAAVFLASELTSYITGEVVHVNGGSVLCG